MNARIDRLVRTVQTEWRLVLGGLICLATFTAVAQTGDLDSDRIRFGVVVLISWVLFALAVGVALGHPRWGRTGRRHDPAAVPDRARGRRRLALVALFAAGCQVPGVLVAPQSSSDAYRYVWDGRVQLSGTSPYRYVPFDDELAALRDPVLFPGLTPAERTGVTTPDRLPTDPTQIRQLARSDPRTEINRPRVPTIYPPVAQAWFTAVAAITPRSWGTHGLQIATALLAVGLTLAFGLLSARRGRDPAYALWWGWSPLVVLEAGNGAHIDVLTAVLVAGAMVVLGMSIRAGRWSQLLGGVLLGLAAATKIIPLILLPAVTVLRSRVGAAPDPAAGMGATETKPRYRFVFPQVPVAAVGTFALSYLPHVAVAGSLVLGYLPGYLVEEGFEEGQRRFAVLGLLLPEPWRQPVALLLGLGLAILALRQADASRRVGASGQISLHRPERTAVWLFGAAILISTPAYGWYCLPLVALAVLARRPEWLWVAMAGHLTYSGFEVFDLPGLLYGVAGLLVLVAALLRRRLQEGSAMSALPIRALRTDPDPGQADGDGVQRDDQDVNPNRLTGR